MTERQKSLILIHSSVLLFGLTGLFAKAIVLPAQYIVLGRVFFASLFMGILFIFTKKNICLRSAADYIILFFLGALLALHWFSFFFSVKLSTVAIGLLTFSSYPLFVTFLEPILFHEKIRPLDIISSIVIVIGVAFIVPSFDISDSVTGGVLWGMVCAVTYAVLSLYNRKLVSEYDGTVVAFYEQASAALVLLPILVIFKRPSASPVDLGLLILLGVVFTAAAHSMFISGMRFVRAQTAGVIAGLETVYGVIAAAVLLGEAPSIKEIIGGILILGAAFVSTIFSSKDK